MRASSPQAPGFGRCSITSALVACLSAAPAWAEEPPAAGGEAAAGAAADPTIAAAASPGEEPITGDAEVIEITGSLIQRDNLSGTGPVAVIGRADIENTGATNAKQILEKLPATTLRGVNRNVNNGGAGLTHVDLRNLDIQRTLVLVNGRRFVNTGTGYTDSVDLGNIPVALIERMEVLLDGASAIYGSDAIGGVVNIILKKDFQGVRFDVTGGIADDGDGEELMVSGTFGQTFGRGNITGNITYSRRQPVMQADRAWARQPYTDVLRNPDDTLHYQVGSAIIPEGFTTLPNARLRQVRPEASPNGSEKFFFPARDGQSYGYFSDDDRYNFGPEQFLVGGQQRLSTTLLGEYRLRGSTRLYAEAFYINRRARTQLSPEGLGTTATFPEGLLIPREQLPEDFRNLLDDRVSEVKLQRRMLEAGNRENDFDSDTFRLVTGMAGRLVRRFDWNVYFNYGRNETTRTLHNAINFARARETVNPALCAASAARGCPVRTDEQGRTVPAASWFGRGALDQSVIDYIRYDDVTLFDTTHLSSEATLRGPLWQLPGGDLQFAAGAMARREEGSMLPSGTVAGGDATQNQIEPLSGGYDVLEAFGELHVPLVRHLPALHELSTDLAVRNSHFTRFGSDVTYRAGLVYAPLADLRLRGSYSTAYRAPSVSELYAGNAVAYDSADDPCSRWGDPGRNPALEPEIQEKCRAAGIPADYDQTNQGTKQLRTNAGGNPDLETESARVFSAGMVFWPRFADGLSMTADYFHARVDDAITKPQAQRVLDECYRGAGSLCGNIHRDASGHITTLERRAQNIGALSTSGVDLTVAYDAALASLGLPELGRLRLSWKGNYLLHLEETIAGVTVDRVGKMPSNGGSFTRLRWNAEAQYALAGWTVNNAVRYIGGAEHESRTAEQPFHSVGAVAYWDASLRYDRRTFSLIAGVENLLDSDPPFFIDGATNSNPFTYDYVGRFVYTRASYSF
jgi:iron complex outermembrane receptor protein